MFKHRIGARFKFFLQHPPKGRHSHVEMIKIGGDSYQSSQTEYRKGSILQPNFGTSGLIHRTPYIDVVIIKKSNSRLLAQNF